ncbi:hypothetical protein PP427_gp111 [Salmonella phage KM16]|nr:hypothetical protein PP427_gp111 [Salmonella phage KM16]
MIAKIFGFTRTAERNFLGGND